MPYRVELDVFHGPFDLLLYLVQREEVDVLEIPISRITRQFLSYLSALQSIDVERVGEFLVVASTLMEIKSRMLLPRAAASDEEDDDPRSELVRQLLEYRKFRNAGASLMEIGQAQALRFARIPEQSMPATVAMADEPIRDVELWDLVSAFGRLLRETAALAPANIIYDETPIETYMERICERLAERGTIVFSDLVRDTHRGQRLGLFLAVLELMKARRIRAEQNELFGEIWLLPISSADDSTTTPDIGSGVEPARETTQVPIQEAK